VLDFVFVFGLLVCFNEKPTFQILEEGFIFGRTQKEYKFIHAQEKENKSNERNVIIF